MKIGLRKIRRAAALVLALAALVIPVTGWLHGQVRKFLPAPRFEGATIPDPPRQGQPWTPPETSLPRFLVRASATLFEQGLADPRGGDYRAIEIVVGSVWSNAGEVLSTHGWVLPEAQGDKTRFAVTWSGMVYPTVSVGAPADLEADVKALEDTGRARRKAAEERPGVGSADAFDGFGTNHEAFPISLTGLHPTKVALLLRLGRADFAERVWAAATGRPREEAGKAKARVDLTHYGVSYVTMATDLAWYHFDRALCAHMRGDDAVALADARALTALQKAVEAKAEALGFARPQRLVDRGEGPAPYIDFLGQLPELLADHERRAREPKRPLAPPAAGADRKARIAALIADLDQVFAPQFGQPGGVSLGESPIVRALIEEGDEAVEPLIDDLERDTRLTRAVHFHRDFFRSRTIMGAHEAAYTALSGILKTSFFGVASTGGNLTTMGLEGRKAVADRIRAYREKNRGVSLVEQWYRTLADDIAAPGEWLQAAGNIVQHENVSVVPGSTAFTQTVTTQLPPGARPKLRGELLRDKKDPSVAELMAMRVRDIDPGDPIDRNSPDQFKVSSANQMASMLAEWDIKAALPVLKARVERCARVVRAGQEAGARVFGLEIGIAELTDLRTRAGDPEALGDYAAWVRTLTPHHFDFFPSALFKPLWQNPDDLALAAAAAALFEDPSSPWNPQVWRGDATVAEGHQRDLFTTPLLGLKAFRSLVIRALNDKTVVGTVETDAKGRVIVIQGHYRTVSDDESTAHGVNYHPDGPKNPYKPGPEAMPLHMADIACEQLEGLDGIPRFKKHWPLTRRDEAIAATVAYMKRYGERFRENAASRAIRALEPGDPNGDKAILAFDPLDHPATAVDVAEGRAIFSLDGAGAEVRRVALAPFPIDARWTKAEVSPDEFHLRRIFDAEGHGRPDIEGLQTGRVWQAEEVREGDRWRRSYGFVGRHALTRVPAEEIEFRASWQQGWSPLSTDLDARIVVKDAATTGPIPVEVQFRNHRGVEATVPTDLARDVQGEPTLREGIAFRLIRVSDQAERPDPFARRQGGAPEKPFPPEEIAARPLHRHPKGSASQTLAPASEAPAFRLDLRIVFPVDRPGRYRLEISFDDLKAADGSQCNVVSEFGVVSRAKK
jgi:hypothetical protein